MPMQTAGDGGGAKTGPGGSLVSAKEERDLAALLDLFALGGGRRGGVPGAAAGRAVRAGGAAAGAPLPPCMPCCVHGW